MALWHTPALLDIKLGTRRMQFIHRDKPPRYYPMAGGYWTLDLALVPFGEPAPAFHWFSDRVERVCSTIHTGNFSFELKGPKDGAAGPGALGAIAGAVFAGGRGTGQGTPLAVTFHNFPAEDRQLKLLVAASPNMIADLDTNAGSAAAKLDW